METSMIDCVEKSCDCEKGTSEIEDSKSQNTTDGWCVQNEIAHLVLQKAHEPWLIDRWKINWSSNNNLWREEWCFRLCLQWWNRWNENRAQHRVRRRGRTRTISKNAIEGWLVNGLPWIIVSRLLMVHWTIGMLVRTGYGMDMIFVLLRSVHLSLSRFQHKNSHSFWLQNETRSRYEGMNMWDGTKIDLLPFHDWLSSSASSTVISCVELKSPHGKRRDNHCYYRFR